MRRLNLRESTFAHAGTALGVLAAILILASGPLGRSPAANSPAGLGFAAAANSATPETAPSESRPLTQPDTVSSRGGREASPLAAAEPSPTPTAGPEPRVGIQAGHWKENELPAELAVLRGGTGAEGSGWREVDVNLDIARRVTSLLEKQNIIVDLLPATIPVQYKADAFVALHGDANSDPNISGYKLASSSRSSIPAKDDALLNAISKEYAAATGLHFSASTITVNMTAYYAFANRGIAHSIAPTTPGVILEMGFLTNPKDRALLMQQPDLVAGAIAKGILKFLGK